MGDEISPKVRVDDSQQTSQRGTVGPAGIQNTGNKNSVLQNSQVQVNVTNHQPQPPVIAFLVS